MNGHETDAAEEAEDQEFRDLLGGLRIWNHPLPAFDPVGMPAEPVSLFRRWLWEAAAAGCPDPHCMALATADTEGRPSSRMMTLADADARGWHFASLKTSRKGQELGERPDAALLAYWPVHGRQVRIRGPVTVADAAAGAADLAGRSPGARAAALVGRQSEVLAHREDLASAFETVRTAMADDPRAPVPTWRRYLLEPDEVEFFQGTADRRHIRLRYRRTSGARPQWTQELLWP
ncbi:pyridoxal 5'-phosphate synthase [Streptomyces sp. NPDC090045]|uniref:pyridoxine/pyridoxamine 5'-phosphate oxidase n=1 Tax=Streptomyces sp. NPDC090045 TaxID=3365927 RepID=UPI003828000C